MPGTPNHGQLLDGLWRVRFTDFASLSPKSVRDAAAPYIFLIFESTKK